MKQSFMVLAILAVTFGNGAVVNAEFHSTSAANAPPMVAVATVMAYTGTTTINADSKSAARGYATFEVTDFKPGRHLVQGVRSDGSRSGQVLVDTDSATWPELDVSTAAGRVSLRLEFVNPSTLSVSINGTVVSQGTLNATGGWDITYLPNTVVDQVLLQLDFAGMVAEDENVNAHRSTLGVFAQAMLEPAPDTATQPAPPGGCNPPAGPNPCPCQGVHTCTAQTVGAGGSTLIARVRPSCRCGLCPRAEDPR